MHRRGGERPAQEPQVREPQVREPRRPAGAAGAGAAAACGIVSLPARQEATNVRFDYAEAFIAALFAVYSASHSLAVFVVAARLRRNSSRNAGLN